MNEFPKIGRQDIAPENSPLSQLRRLGGLIKGVAVGVVKEAQGEPQRLNPFSTQPPEVQIPTNK